ncbi:MAG: chromosome segregation protein SMC [Candidatus Omnitrophota bacterium]
MYFKRLELFGFKSFAKKITLDFEPGVTAVVGPNGCGKSNISDAMRWVLGEQSAKSMRGAKMEDVIFNGTDKEPALNLAEVSLTLSNEEKILPIDYDEVTITRRLYRSGESEYLINNNLVRLKDVSELLMGTGMGTESYSMFEQGKMDLIISSKPEDRRFLFEEASGITRYKSKKREALRKLEQTEANLLRVNDIITEVTRQLNAIQRQVNKARRYKDEFERLKALEIRFAAGELRNFHKEQDDLLTRIKEYRIRESDIEENLRQLSGQLEELRRETSNVEIAYSRLQKEYLDLASAIDKNVHKITLNKERVEEYQARGSELTKNIENTTKKIEAISRELTEYQNTLSEQNLQEEKQRQTLLDKENSLQEINCKIKKAHDNIEQGKLCLIEIAARQAKTKNDLTKSSADLANICARIRRLGVEKEKVNDTNREIETKFSKVKEELEVIRGYVTSLRNEEISLSINIQEEEEYLNSITTVLLELNHRFNAIKTRLDFLEDMNRRYEGFASGTKALLQGKDSSLEIFKGIIGPLANMFEVDSGYEQAVEVALGDMSGSIVVENRVDAVSAVRYLKEKQLGNALIISLADVPVNEHLHTEEDLSALKRLGDLVRVRSEYQPLVEYLLKDTFIVSDFDQALSLNEKYSEKKFRFVTPKGEMVQESFFFVGVKVLDEEHSVITRLSKIRQLKEEFQKLNIEILEREELKNKRIEALNGLKTEIDTKRTTLHEKELVLTNKEAEFTNIEEQRRKLNEEFSLINLEADEANEREQELENKQGSLRQELEVIEEKQKTWENSIQESDLFAGEAVKSREDLLVQIAQLKTELLNISQTRQTTEKTFKMLELSGNELTIQLSSQKNEVAELERKHWQLNSEITELERENTTFGEKKEKMGNELTTSENRRNEIREKADATQKTVHSLSQQQDGIKNELRDLEIKKNEFNYKVQALLTRMLEAYKVVEEQICQEELAGEWDAAGLRQEIDSLKIKLEKLGTVNLVAIEEEQDLTERLNFLNSQRHDLLTAQETLHKAILKINRTTKTMFMETFEKTRATFREFFRMLFDGGDGQLILLDESDVLESGIEIAVRPPGKKLQSITLLSGGEKALTAIALLFAVFKVNPSPFCVLDEIDAPLDEANILRFTKVLQEFLKLSQFIIITHNKKTIGMADVMYGVTMQEFGISTIVSVKFKEMKKEMPAERKEDLVAS